MYPKVNKIVKQVKVNALKVLCTLDFNHRLTKYSNEDIAGSQRYRFVAECKCGKNKEKSVPIHDNDLLSTIGLSHKSFPVDVNA